MFNKAASIAHSLSALCMLQRFALLLLAIMGVKASTLIEKQQAMQVAKAAARQGFMRVTTAAHFDAAMRVGVRFIRIEEHLDLRHIKSYPLKPSVMYQLNTKIEVIQVCADWLWGQ